MVRFALLFALVACNSNTYHTHAFTAPTSCGQGPYDVHIPADGTTAEDGIEVVACTPRALAGHVELSVGTIGMVDNAFGEGSADNGRCVGGPAIVAVAGSGSTTSAAGGDGSATAAPQPVFVEQAFTGDESAWGDDLCKPYGVAAQTLLIPTTMTRTTTGFNVIEHGTDLHVRIWSDVPNDLSGVTFLVREVMSTDKPKPPKPYTPSHDDHVASAQPPPPPHHDAPPAPLAEIKPDRTSNTATWVPGYWTWTGAHWGWSAGFWRDGVDVPSPRVEVPGDAPAVGAIWIGGNWRRQGGSWVWIAGRWRAR